MLLNEHAVSVLNNRITSVSMRWLYNRCINHNVVVFSDKKKNNMCSKLSIIVSLVCQTSHQCKFNENATKQKQQFSEIHVSF